MGLKASIINKFFSKQNDATSVGGIVEHIEPAVQETSLDGGSGTGVDLAGYEGALIVIVQGAYVDGSTTITIKDSDSAATSFSACATTDLVGGAALITVTNTATAGTISVREYIGGSRYLRVDLGAATTGHIIGAYVLRHSKKNLGVLNSDGF